MSFEIAITGLSCRFPQAADKAAFWSLLTEGRTAFRPLDRAEAAAEGMPDDLLDAGNYVPVAAMLDDIETFDAGFFNIPAREALVLDPQHRLFLECAWEALEDAGLDPARPGASDIGVFAGASLNSYLIANLACDPRFLSTPAGFMALVGNEKDYLASRVAYRLNLHGPAITVQTACSTSLVAVHLAMQSLLLGECDAALAGGVSLKVPSRVGYLHQEGMPFSSDGRCLPFDDAGTGTVFGSGAGVVVLKTREAAEAAGDDIYALIRASACNNDGNRKVGFTAPSTDGQADVLRRAVLMAGVAPAEVSYVEAHGTATPLGDPIEVAALGEVYGRERTAPCRLGSVKSNIGHMETASGVAGLIKTALMLRHRHLVPSVGFTRPNAHIDFAAAGLAVQDRAEPWPAPGPGLPRLAALSSFGMGGTNVHLILEEAPPSVRQAPRRRAAALGLLSARSDKALAAAARQLDGWLADHPAADLAEVAAWQQQRSPHLPVRQAFLAADPAQARRCLTGGIGEQVFVNRVAGDPPDPVFVYCGGGAQYPGMMADLPAEEPVFRAALETCIDLFRPILGEDLGRFLAPAARGDLRLARRMQDPDVMFPALFAVQHAMGELLTHWGVRPALVMGHSNGEYAAAVRAGVMDVETAVGLVGARSMLMMSMAPGGMLAVAADAGRVAAVAAEVGLSIGAFNGPASVVLSGETERLRAAEDLLTRRDGVECRQVHVNAALHSSLTAAIADAFAEIAATRTFHAPRLPWISTLTGGFMDPARAPTARYWVDHLCSPVRFAEAAATLLGRGGASVVIDLGPGRVAGDLLRQNSTEGAGPPIIHAARGHAEATSDSVAVLAALAKFWTLGGTPDWERFQEGAAPARPDLPHYPWQRQRYWIDPPRGGRAATLADSVLADAAAAAADEGTAREGLAGEGLAGEGLAGDRPVLTSPYRAAGSETEKRLLVLWRSYLGVQDIGTLDDFIELGGTSLLATELVGAIRREFNLELELGTFLELRGIAALACRLDEMEAAEEQRLMAEALAEIAGKSDAELQALLAPT